MQMRDELGTIYRDDQFADLYPNVEIRVKTGHKNTAEDLHAGKTTACMVGQVCFHSPCSSIRVEAGVRKWFCQSVMQQAIFTRIKLNRSSVREGLLFWMDLSMAGNDMYPELTPTTSVALRPDGRRAARPTAGPK
jgi:hypothetical protein